MKKFYSWVLAATLTCGAVNVYAQDNYTVTKISNPDRGEREVDGLMPGGDRENSYTWRLAMRGDEIYIATTRNIASALVNLYAPAFAASGISVDSFWSMIDVVTNGDIPRNDANEGANIISYNRKTGEFKVIYTGEKAVYYRMAVTFGDNVYFGSYSADPTVSQYILKLDKDGNFTKVFETMGSVSLRANCEYDGHLFFAGADDREVVDADAERIPTKMAVLRKSNEDDTVWERVADYKDFGDVAYDDIMSSWAGAPIWELASHDGYIYATAPSHAGFVIYKGHPAAKDEKANEYGWYWEEVAGLNNGINNPGLSDVVGGEPGTMRSLIGSVYEFKGKLYAYNFDHSFGGEASAFAGFLQQVAGKDVKASEYLFYMFNSLQNPQKVWCLNDETGKFEELKNFTKLMEGTTNEYIWRLGEYDGQLYIATMDAGIFYGYLTQLTNGNFFNMSQEEKYSKIGYITKAIQLLVDSKKGEIPEKIAKNLAAKLESLKTFLDQFVETERIDDNTIMVLINYSGMIQEIVSMIESSISNLPDADNAQSILEQARQAIQDIYDKIDTQGIAMYIYINNTVMINEWGFDMFRTSDGETFETITRNGFGDKYNYGCPSFLATEEGLYFGTCNPFYGGQLYPLTNNPELPEDATDIHITKADVENNPVFYTLSGQRLSGRPTLSGIYIQGNKKVFVK
ncbi:MAG: hypothetical protein IJ901_00385 [Bacteroidaceae bacterium]|nr:hypothetical protein [Bacteroidaceae bacterium]